MNKNRILKAIGHLAAALVSVPSNKHASIPFAIERLSEGLVFPKGGGYRIIVPDIAEAADHIRHALDYVAGDAERHLQDALNLLDRPMTDTHAETMKILTDC